MDSAPEVVVQVGEREMELVVLERQTKAIVEVIGLLGGTHLVVVAQVQQVKMAGQTAAQV
jgi:hypothetical protein